MWDGFPDEGGETLAAQAPFPNRFGTADEFAAMACHIIDNVMLNGTTIRLDGGLRMQAR